MEGVENISNLSTLGDRVRELVSKDESGGGVSGTSQMSTPSHAQQAAHHNTPQLPQPLNLLSPQKAETVPTAFKWVHGGHEVFITGSFNNWQGKILMYPNDDGEFTLLIDIPPGTHHYKYIVDQEWRLDEDAPTVQINNVWNNVIEVQRPVFEYSGGTWEDSDDEEDANGNKKISNYGQKFPAQNDYVQDPPKLPPHLTDILLNQSSPQDPLMLPIPTHVILNHLYVSKTDDPEVLVTAITQRFKPNSHTKITHRFVTTVYYAPRNRNKITEFFSLNSLSNPSHSVQSSPVVSAQSVELSFPPNLSATPLQTLQLPPSYALSPLSSASGADPLSLPAAAAHVDVEMDSGMSDTNASSGNMKI